MNVRQYYRPSPGFPVLFFDQFSNGMGGFSFRKLVGSYSGRWGRALNKTTLEERDIGFVDNYADTANILDLSHGTDTVELMAYNNSFISIYFSPDSALNRYPILVNSGTLVTLGGLAAADFPAARRIAMSMSILTTIDPVPVSIYSLGKIDLASQRNLSVASSTGNTGYFHDGTLTGYDGIGVFDTSSNISSLSGGDTNRRLGTYYWDSTTLKMASNGSSLSSFTGRSGAFVVRNIGVGQVSTAQAFSGKIQEVLFFSVNKESDDSAIRANINSFYSIY